MNAYLNQIHDSAHDGTRRHTEAIDNGSRYKLRRRREGSTERLQFAP